MAREAHRLRFQDELRQLEDQALGALDLVLVAMDRTLEALEHQDIELAAIVVADDDRLDGRYLEVHQGILSLLALQAPAQRNPLLGPGITMVSFILIMYFLIIRPQRKIQMQHRAMVEGIKKGDEVMTEGGIIGNIVHIADDRVTIKSADARIIVAGQDLEKDVCVAAVAGSNKFSRKAAATRRAASSRRPRLPASPKRRAARGSQQRGRRGTSWPQFGSTKSRNCSAPRARK